MQQHMAWEKQMREKHANSALNDQQPLLYSNEDNLILPQNDEWYISAYYVWIFFSLIVFSTFVYVMITTEYFLDSIEHLAIERWPILFCVNEVQNWDQKMRKRIYGVREFLKKNGDFFHLRKGEKTIFGGILCK